jgi:hypothetical protein
MPWQRSALHNIVSAPTAHATSPSPCCSWLIWESGPVEQARAQIPSSGPQHHINQSTIRLGQQDIDLQTVRTVGNEVTSCRMAHAPCLDALVALHGGWLACCEVCGWCLCGQGVRGGNAQDSHSHAVQYLTPTFALFYIIEFDRLTLLDTGIGLRLMSVRTFDTPRGSECMSWGQPPKAAGGLFPIYPVAL